MEGASYTPNDQFGTKVLFLSNGLQQGEFIIGPKVDFTGQSFKYTSEWMAKLESSETCVILKVLQSAENVKGSLLEYNQEKSLLHNEHLILSLLQDQPGVIQHLGLFKHHNGFILAIECVMSHDFDKQGVYADYVNLQQYIIHKKRLQDREALGIFCEIAATVNDLHKKNIVHRDLKLGNIAYNKRTKKVKISNFSMSKHLVRDTELLSDQKGRLAYVSPDILSGHPYDGKASDMWAVGVMLYTMVCGQFPFYDVDPEKLFKKICTNDLYFPSWLDGTVSPTMDLVKKLIITNPYQRITAKQSLETAKQLLCTKYQSYLHTSEDTDAQVVPYHKEVSESCSDGVVPISNQVGASTTLAMTCVTGGLTLKSLMISSKSSCGMSKEYFDDMLLNSKVKGLDVSSQQCKHCLPIISHQVLHKKPKEIGMRPRRHSAAVFQTQPVAAARQRRFSHGARDGSHELLENLHTVSKRRCSTSSINMN